MNQKHIAEGTVAFQSLRKHDEWQGQSTGKFTLTLSLPEDVAEALQSEGVKLKDYEGTAQRKFSSQYTVPVLNEDGTPFDGDVTRGSHVRILYSYGKPHPVHGTSTYLDRVKVLDLAETTLSESPEDF
jgi:hypothetical protein|tara:strand:- start:10651 stop:11034 length:384 start_codon:yes stop_codon:yes gene_type:complete